MSTMADPHSSLKTSLAGVQLSGPIISAAGTGGTATELADVLNLADLGAVTTKSITPEPRAGNAAMRVADVPAGMLNAVGLMNMGVEAFIDGTVPTLAGATPPSSVRLPATASRTTCRSPPPSTRSRACR